MSAQKATAAFEILLQEERRYPPPQEFQRHANISDPVVYQEAAQDLEGFWARQAESRHWFRNWDRVLEWDAPWAKCFGGGLINACYNCVDRHVATWRRNKAAIIWEGEPRDERVLTYQDLYREVDRAALALKQCGVEKSDTVAIELKGQAVAAFVTPRQGVNADDALVRELRDHVTKKIGAIARPERIYFTAELPKTRSAKIMRRLLRDIAEGRVLGDTTTLTDPTVLRDIKQQYEETEG
jgi:non-ribosomal peptide synthetase component E (peptide arylation enzyme)